VWLSSGTVKGDGEASEQGDHAPYVKEKGRGNGRKEKIEKVRKKGEERKTKVRERKRNLTGTTGVVNLGEQCEWDEQKTVWR